MRKLSHQQLKEIAVLCAGAAFLLVAAVFIGSGGVSQISLSALGQPQAAATALGDEQGIPPGFTGQAYPDYTYCWRILDGKFPARGPNCPSLTVTLYQEIDTFFTGVFSVDLGSGQGQSVYTARTESLNNTPVYVGYVPAVYDYSNGAYLPGNCAALVLPAGYRGSAFANGTYSCSGGTLNTEGPLYCSSGDGSMIAPNTNCNALSAGTLSAPSNITSGTPIVVQPGQSMALEWSCLPSRRADWGTCNYSWLNPSCQQVTGTYYDISLASSITGSGSGFSPSGLTGAQTVAAPSTAGVYNYSLTCNGGTNAMTVPVTVAVVPTLSITGNGTNPTTVVAGQPVTIAATFAAQGTDSLTKTAINDYASNLWCGSGNSCSTSMWTASPLGSKSYTFTPNTPGTYVFYPAAQSANFPSWNNYSKSLTVTVTAPTCPNGLNYGTYGPSCTCPGGQVQSGSTCVAQCANGTGPTGACISCNAGYMLSGGSCVPSTCSNGLNYGIYGPSCTCPGGQVQSGSVCIVPTCSNGLNYGTYGPSCTCPGGQVQSGSVCVVPTPSIVSFSTSPTRVRKNTSTPVTFSYTVTNPGASCTISGPAGFTPLTINPVSGVPGTRSGNVTIAGPSIFTLTCGSVSVQSTIGLIPATQEI